MTLLERLKDVAQELGSQVALAKAAGVSESRVSQWLSGELKRFSADTALNIEQRAGYAARWLVQGKGPKRVGGEVRTYDVQQPPAPSYLTDAQRARAMLAVFRRLPPEKQLALLSLFK
jgi:transcriptional regulator with XRE-family HTH domain